MNPSEKTSYEILGVPASASSEEIERAYRASLETFGPASMAGLEGGEAEALRDRLRTLNRAYHRVADPDARQRYDQALRSPQATPAPVPRQDDVVSWPRASKADVSAGADRIKSAKAEPAFDPRIMGWIGPAAAAVLALVVIGVVASSFLQPTDRLSTTTAPSHLAPVPVASGTPGLDPTALLRQNPRDIDSWKRLQSTWQTESEGSSRALGVDAIVRLLANERGEIAAEPVLDALRAVGQLPPPFYVDLADAAADMERSDVAQEVLRFAVETWPREERLTRRLAELAPPASAPADERVTVTVRTNVPHATVMIEGARAGETDARGEVTLEGLSIGTHRIVARRAGFADYGAELTIPDASTRLVSVALKVDFAVITVATGTPDVTVSIDGRPAALTSQVEPGTRTVTVSKAGFQTVTRRVDLAPGQTLTIPVSLDALPAAPPSRPASDALMVELRAFDAAVNEGRTSVAVERMADAIANGLLVLVPVHHDHRNLRIHYLSGATLTFSRSHLVFVSQQGEDSFAARWSDIEEASINRVHGDKAPHVIALSLKVALRDVAGKKRRTRTFNLFPPGASVYDGDVRCTDCSTKVPAYLDLVRALKQTTPVQSFERPVEGVYFGPVSEGFGNLTAVVTQRDSGLRGTMLLRTGQGVFKGEFGGTLTGNALSFAGTLRSDSGCEIALNGSAGDVTRVAIGGVISAGRTCGEPVRDARFVLVRGDWPVR